MKGQLLVLLKVWYVWGREEAGQDEVGGLYTYWGRS